MGLLNSLGNSIASGFGGGAQTPGGAASASMGWGAASTLLNTAGALTEGIGSAEQYNYAATIARQNSAAALAAGQQAESASKAKFGLEEAHNTTEFAAHGVGVEGSNVRNVNTSLADTSALDAAILHFNALRESGTALAEEATDKHAATGALLGGIFKAGGSFIGGASSLSDKWLAFKQSGANGNSLVVPSTPGDSSMSPIGGSGAFSVPDNGGTVDLLNSIFGPKA